MSYVLWDFFETLDISKPKYWTIAKGGGEACTKGEGCKWLNIGTSKIFLNTTVSCSINWCIFWIYIQIYFTICMTVVIIIPIHIYRPRNKVQHLVIFIILWEMQSFPLVVLQIYKFTSKMFVSMLNKYSLKSNHVCIRCPPYLWEQGEQCPGFCR